MLFLFVLMIVGIWAKDSLVETIRGQRVAAGLAGDRPAGPAQPDRRARGPRAGRRRPARLRREQRVRHRPLIFTTYVFPFEVTSALLITAALGAMVLAHRERLTPKLTQRHLSRLRVASGRPPRCRARTYARHNAVDMPALLPDGTPAEQLGAGDPGRPETPDQRRTLPGSSAPGRGAGGGDRPGQGGDA